MQQGQEGGRAGRKKPPEPRKQEWRAGYHGIFQALKIVLRKWSLVAVALLSFILVFRGWAKNWLHEHAVLCSLINPTFRKTLCLV